MIFELVKVGDRMNFFGIGKPHIYGIYRPSDNFMLTLNQEHSYRCPIKHLYLPRISDILLNPGEKVTCSLNKKQLSNGIRLVQLDRNSDIWTYKQKEVT